jgi:hypothetical protein
VSAWSDDDDLVLRRMHGKVPAVEIAKALGRSCAAIRNRAYRLGITENRRWTTAEEESLRAFYEDAGESGVVRLDDAAKLFGRDKSNVCRKARELGLNTNQSRKKVEVRKDRPKFDTDEERRAAKSAQVKEWQAKNGHPRGMAGKKHTSEVKAVISQKSNARWAAMTEDERLAETQKQVNGRRANGTTQAKKPHGSWKAGWREIGGKRNYYRSRWEANYARYLQWLKEEGYIKEWKHEPETFWFEAIKRGVRSYLPDFRVWENDGSSALHEVKGWMDARSRTTLARMAKYHPQEKVVLIDGVQYRSIRSKMMHIIPNWEDSERDRHA